MTGLKNNNKQRKDLTRIMNDKTELKNKLVSEFPVFNKLSALLFGKNIHGIKKDAISKFNLNGFPGRKDEEWRYTNIEPVLKNDYSIAIDSDIKK